MTRKSASSKDSKAADQATATETTDPAAASTAAGAAEVSAQIAEPTSAETPATESAQPDDQTVTAAIETVDSIGPGEQIGNSGLPPAGSGRLKVRAVPKKGFWRAGRYWPHGGVDVGFDELTEDEWIALEMEPKIVISEVE